MMGCVNRIVASAVDRTDLITEEQSLLSVAYRHVVHARRYNLRKVYDLEVKERSGHRLRLIRDLRVKLEQELEELCESVIRIIGKLDPLARSRESQTFYLKM